MEITLTSISAWTTATPDSGQGSHMPGRYDHLNKYSGPEISATISGIGDFEGNDFIDIDLISITGGFKR